MTTAYRKTISACHIGFVVQAAVNNFAPLLFLTFQSSFGISLTKITLLVTLNFSVQLMIALLAAFFLDWIGYRVTSVLAHVFAATGFILLTFLPELFSDPFTGLFIATMIYACGSGLLEVLMGPMVESCPTDNKEKAMSLLHSFYCWGHMGVVLFSTLFFYLFGIHNWRILALLWAILPVLNAVSFAKLPLIPVVAKEHGVSIKELSRTKKFWIFLLLLACAGASEQAVGQWASSFAEQGLGVSKTIGDLAGPMMFAIMMAISRTIYGRYGDRIDLTKYVLYSGLLCLLSYVIISLSPWPLLGLLACGLCGFAVGILCPGAFSMAARSLPRGGTALFVCFALAVNLGCTLGPTLVGFISNALGNNLKLGILAAILFPLGLVVIVVQNKAAEAAKRKRCEAGLATD